MEAQETLSQQALLPPTSPNIADQLNLKFSMDFLTLATYGAHYKSIRISVVKKLSLNLNLSEYLCCDLFYRIRSFLRTCFGFQN